MPTVTNMKSGKRDVDEWKEILLRATREQYFVESNSLLLYFAECEKK